MAHVDQVSRDSKKSYPDLFGIPVTTEENIAGIP
jgi:hypothetical protein